MRKPNLSRLLFIGLVFIFSCSNYEEQEIIEPELTIETIKVADDQLLQQLIESNIGAIPNGRTMTSPYGTIDLEHAVRVDNPELNTVRYSLLLSNETNPYGFDNYIIRDREGEVTQYIISYLPDPDWVLANAVDPDWSTYTGGINAYEPDGTIITEDYLTDGVSEYADAENGRVNECYDCHFEVKESKATGKEYIVVSCDDGSQFLMFFRIECEGGGGGSGGSGGSSGGTGGDYTGGTGSGGSTSGGTGGGGGGGPTGGSTSGGSSGGDGDFDDGDGTDPIGILPTGDLAHTFLGLSVAESQWLISNPAIDASIKAFLTTSGYSEEVKAFANELINAIIYGDDAEKDASLMTLEVINMGGIDGPYDANYFQAIDSYTDADLTNPAIQAAWMAHFSAQCAILKFQHPDWPDHRIYWEASKEMIHLALDIVGLVPVVGELFDAANGILYLIEGDGVNASLSFAATIPIGGWWATGAKFAMKAIETAKGGKTVLKWTVKADGLIIFGNRGQLARVLGTKGTGQHAHHIIPWERADHPLVQKAAKSSKEFHMNEALNGIPLSSSNHLTGHNLYSTKVRQILNNFDDLNPNLSPDEAYNFIEGFTGYLKNLIQTNPNKNLGEISGLISY